MSQTKKLLDGIVDLASRDEPVVVVRALNRELGVSSTFTLRGSKLVPPVEDPKLSEYILAALDSLASKRGITDLIDVLDGQGRPVTLVIEIVKPKVQLLVFGAGHVGQAVAIIGALIGYDVTVIDDREEFASRKRLPDPRINLLVSDYSTAAEKLAISSSTAVVIVTRGHQHDEACLKSVVRSKAGYLGMIGSRRRVMSVFKKLTEEGIPEAELQRVQAPIGLRIGARSPQEIAVAILAEIIDKINNPEREKKGERDGI